MALLLREKDRQNDSKFPHLLCVVRKIQSHKQSLHSFNFLLRPHPIPINYHSFLFSFCFSIFWVSSFFYGRETKWVAFIFKSKFQTNQCKSIIYLINSFFYIPTYSKFDLEVSLAQFLNQALRLWRQLPRRYLVPI